MSHPIEPSATTATVAFKAVIVSHAQELDAYDMPVPVDCQTIELYAASQDDVPVLVAAFHPGYELVDCWQPVEQDCPF